MEYFPAEIPITYWIFGLAILGVVMVVFTFIQALVMRFANSVCGGDRIGIFYAAAVVWGSALVGGFFSGTTRVALGEEAAWSPMLAGAVSTVLSLCLMLQLDPLRAFAVYLVYSISGIVMAVFFSLILVFGVMQTMSSEAIERLGSQASRWNGEAGGSTSAREWGRLLSLVRGAETRGGESSEAALTAEADNPFFKRKAKPSVQSTAAKAAAGARTEAPQTDTARSTGASGKQPRAASSPSSKSATEKRKPSLPRRLLNDTPVVNPLGGRVRSNPFVE